MGRIKLPEPVKLVVAMLAGETAAFDEAACRLTALYGEIDYAGPPIAFDVSAYYEAEMGGGLARRFFAFRRLIDPGELAEVKVAAMAVEADLSSDGRRRVNLDPGYLSAGKLVLATCKNQQHRIYLGKGVFAEVALRYRDGAWQPWEWTYRDYRSPEYARVLDEIRALYMAQRADQLHPPARSLP